MSIPDTPPFTGAGADYYMRGARKFTGLPVAATIPDLNISGDSKSGESSLACLATPKDF